MRISDWSSDVCSSDVDDRGHDVDVEEAGGGDQRQQRVQPQPVGCLRGGGRLVAGGGVCGGGHASWSRRLPMAASVASSIGTPASSSCLRSGASSRSQLLPSPTEERYRSEKRR